MDRTKCSNCEYYNPYYTEEGYGEYVKSDYGKCLHKDGMLNTVYEDDMCHLFKKNVVENKKITFTADKFGVFLKIGETMTKEECIRRGFDPIKHPWLLKEKDND